ncbi:MAG: hypothetical protein QNJ97_13920 [Myxococcota bacterium]|nr:hypothetical protein [Myxococcota bacterium]
MIWQPVLLVIIALDTMTAVAVCILAAIQVRIALGWQGGAATQHQLLLERRAETAALIGRAILIVWIISTVAALVAITSVLPGLIPGAMCGMGAVQASGNRLASALLLRCIALAGVYAWRTLDRLNYATPVAPLTTASARLGLFCVPLVAVAIWHHLAALGHLDITRVVDCCAAVYDTTIAETGEVFWLSDTVLVGIFLAGSVVLVSWTGWMAAVKKRRGSPFKAVSVALVSLAWAWVASHALVRLFAAYHYGVLHHTCPYCLFLPDHYGIGFFIFGGLALLVLEGVTVPICVLAASKAPSTACYAQKRQRRALALMAGFTALTTLIIVGPALIWRLEHGVWIR